jgi:hypothetical protein
MITLNEQIEFLRKNTADLKECGYDKINAKAFNMRVAILKTLETVKLLHERKKV